MRDRAPFTPADLRELDERLLAPAERVVAMEDVHDGDRSTLAVGMRHDVDGGHALAVAVDMAAWEAERGYRSTYYILHTSPYWEARDFADSLYRIAGHGHEIGIHTDALARALVTGEDPDVILDRAIGTLRGYGFRIRGVAGHGNALCNRDRGEGEITFANDEQFVECARPQEGEPDRLITRGNIQLRLAPRPLADFGLEYEALRLGVPFPFRCSDSGGKWLNPGFDETAVNLAQTLAQRATRRARTAMEPRQLHLLIHPDWWQQAFVPEAVAA